MDGIGMFEQVLRGKQRAGVGHEEDAGRNRRMRMKKLFYNLAAGWRVGHDFSW